MKHTLLLIMLVLCINLFSSTTGKIKGIITDENGNPLADANITIENTTLGAESDNEGYYYIVGVRAGTYTVRCQFMGYSSLSQKVKVRTGLSSKLNFKLYPMDFELDEIVYMCASHNQVQRGITSSHKMIGSSIMSMNLLSKRNSNIDIIDRNIDDLSYYDNSNKKNSEEYNAEEENPFLKTKKHPVSTFSIDVDNASYTIIRRFVTNGQKPKKEAVRIEEMINYFSYDYPKPINGNPFSIISEVSKAPWSSNKLLHIGLQGKDNSDEKMLKNNLVFLLDVSGSMQSSNKLPLVKKSMKLLLNNLNKQDRVAIVVYAGAAGVILESTPVKNKSKIINALDNLRAGGSTAGGDGIKLAYKIAKNNFINKGNNRIILATDGDFNVGISATSELVKMIKKNSKEGIFLTITGYGMGNYKDDKMEKIADNGNGNYFYIDNFSEAKKIFQNQISGTLYAIAKDVKIQLEFNDDLVESYRLIGYENRKLKKTDFENDTIDAGELGANHTVTALYELIMKKDEQNENDSSNIAKVNFRYKKIDENQSNLIVRNIIDKDIELEDASDNFRFSAAVAELGMILRESKYVANSTLDQVKELALNSKSYDKNGYKNSFIDLVNDCIYLSDFGLQKPKTDIFYLPEPKTYVNIDEIIKNEPGITTDFRGNFHFRGGRTYDIEYTIADISTNDKTIMFAKPLKLNFITMDYRSGSSAYSKIENYNLIDDSGTISNRNDPQYKPEKNDASLQFSYATDSFLQKEGQDVKQGEISYNNYINLPGYKKPITYYTALNFSLKNGTIESYKIEGKHRSYNKHDLFGLGIALPQKRENDANFIFKAFTSPTDRLKLNFGYFRINSHNFGHTLFNRDSYNFLYKNSPMTISESKTNNHIMSFFGSYVIDQKSYLNFKYSFYQKKYEYLPGSNKPSFFLDDKLEFSDGYADILLKENSYNLYEAYANTNYKYHSFFTKYFNQLNKNHLLKLVTDLKLYGIDYYQIYAPQIAYSPLFNIKAKQDDRYPNQGYYKTDFKVNPFNFKGIIGDKLEFEDLVIYADLIYDFEYLKFKNSKQSNLSKFSTKLEISHSINETSKISIKSNFLSKFPSYASLYENMLNSQKSKLLKNEKIKHYEISYIKAFYDYQLNLTFYLRDMKDLVFFKNVFTEDYGYRSYDNSGYNTSEGFEISIDHILKNNYLWELSYTYSHSKGKINLLEHYFYKGLEDFEQNGNLNWNQDHKLTIFSSLISSNKERLFNLPYTGNMVISQTTSFNSGKPYLNPGLIDESFTSEKTPWSVNTDFKVSKSYILLGSWNKFLGVLKFEVNIYNLFGEINNFSLVNNSDNHNAIFSDSENPININNERFYKLGVTYTYNW